MSHSPHIADVSHATFDAEVLARSHKQPVLVDFWAAWCGPCRMLMPLLARLADEYQGRFHLAKVETDNERELAAQYGIRSLPTVKLFRNGTVVDEFMGAQTESAVRAFIDRHLPRAADAVVDRAEHLSDAGRTEEAVALLRAAIVEDGAYARPKLALARLLLSLPADRHTPAMLDECERLLASLPADRRDDAQAVALRTRLTLLRAVVDLPPMEELHRTVAVNPNNSQARYALGVHQALREDYEAAMEQLLELVRRDRRYGDDAGRKTLVSLFQLLGNQHPLVIKYRGLLSRALN